MTRLLTAMLLTTVTIVNYSCKDLKSNAPIEEEMRDSLKKVIPGIRYIGIDIKDHQHVTITLGSKRLFKSDDKHQALVDQLAEMTIYYFEANNYLDDGKVIFVENERTLPTEEDPKKEYDMHLQELLKKKEHHE